MNKFILVLTFFTLTAFAKSHEATRDIASIRLNFRADHARELMGPRYKRSVIAKFEKHDVEESLTSKVREQLPRNHKARAEVIAKAIIEEATKHALDPLFIMAVISGESSFNPEMIGGVGEIGLMQVRPSTGKWIADLKGIEWGGEKSLFDPRTNIKLGVTYLAWLRTKFDGHGQLYLAAYNMGPYAVKNAVSRKVYPKDYPIHVMKRYLAYYKDIGKKKTEL